MLEALSRVAPGSQLREGLDRVLQAHKGALIILGDGPEVLNICSGGFLLDAAFSPQRLSELAKMDGAIILAADVSRIARANVHLVPDPSVPTSETGTRHRTAERVARSLTVPVIAVSEGQRAISVYVGADKYPLRAPADVLDRANQGLQTLQRYRARLDRDAAELNTLEVEDVVALRDIVNHLQLTETMLRLAAEVELHIVELGSEGRLVALQLREVMEEVERARRLVIADYVHEETAWNLEEALHALADLSIEQLADDVLVASMLHLPEFADDIDAPVTPKGYRLLSLIPRLHDGLVEQLVEAFDSLPKLLRATEADLVEMAGVTTEEARAVRDGIRRVAEASVLKRV